MNWEAVFFDFDGVILDSVDVKTRAFAQMYHEHGSEVEDRVRAHHLAHCGMSRFDKFRTYHREFLGHDLDGQELEDLCDRFSRLVLEEVLASPPVVGAYETLEALRRDGIPSFVVSGTPQTELELIIRRLDLAPLFLEVHGSPRTKVDILREILAARRYAPANCLFLGDGLTDHASATTCGLQFLGIVRPGESSLFPSGTRTQDHVSLPARESFPASV